MRESSSWVSSSLSYYSTRRHKLTHRSHKNILVVSVKILGQVPQMWAWFHRYPCENSGTLPPPCPYALYAPRCCPGGFACRLTCTEASLVKGQTTDRGKLNQAAVLYTPTHSCCFSIRAQSSDVSNVPERSSCSSESFSRLTLSSKALLT